MIKFLQTIEQVLKNFCMAISNQYHFSNEYNLLLLNLFWIWKYNRGFRKWMFESFCEKV